ncbi:MAG: cytochrome o ubiquinol oxidase subunit IV [Parachlamydiales bacterium]
MRHPPETIDLNKIGPHGTLKDYIFGFVLSLLLTLTAFYLASEHVFEGWNLVLAIIGLAVVQFIVQMIFFFHIGKEASPQWNLYSFLFMLLIMFILVIGTFWIMYHLNYNMDENMKMPTQEGK